jgi:hypothetical protein
MKYILEATIPTTQYGNIRPTFELESSHEIDLAYTELERVWHTYAEQPLKKKLDGFLKVRTFTGEDILYNDLTHTYTDLTGNFLTSASTYKKKFEKPFNMDFVAGKTAEKNDVASADVKDVWSANSKISTTFGTTVHLVMEQYFKHKATACGDKQYNMPKHPILRGIIESFPEKDADVLPEVFVSDVADKRVGQIDAVVFLDRKKNEVELWDYKTDADLTDKKLDLHFIQLSFYATILENFGYKVKKVCVYNLTEDGWVRHDSEVLDLEELESSL